MHLFLNTFPLFLVFLGVIGKDCIIQPLGSEQDDTSQVVQAIEECGHGGRTVLLPGIYNITSKMTWDLKNSVVDLHGQLSFKPDVEYWLNAENTYRVVFIQSQASWFVVTGSDFEINAYNSGGIQGNGQPWWNYFQTHVKNDGDGRPISLTVWNATNGVVRDFRIESPPFWCNTVAESKNITYEGMYCNATNANPQFFGKNVVPNTDGICTYRSDQIVIRNWDITCGDDCLAIKGNSSNIHASNVTCRGGNGIAFGSLGQYAEMDDLVDNVTMEDVLLTRINSTLQPNMQKGVYFKSWTGTKNGEPPTAGGGGGGHVRNVHLKNFTLDRVILPLQLYQTNGGHSQDLPSTLKFSDITVEDWRGVATANNMVNLACSPAVGCSVVNFINFHVVGPGQPLTYVCKNVTGLTGLQAPCTTTGT